MCSSDLVIGGEDDPDGNLGNRDIGRGRVVALVQFTEMALLDFLEFPVIDFGDGLVVNDDQMIEVPARPRRGKVGRAGQQRLPITDDELLMKNMGVEIRDRKSVV